MRVCGSASHFIQKWSIWVRSWMDICTHRGDRWRNGRTTSSSVTACWLALEYNTSLRSTTNLEISIQAWSLVQLIIRIGVNLICFSLVQGITAKCTRRTRQMSPWREIWINSSWNQLSSWININWVDLEISKVIDLCGCIMHQYIVSDSIHCDISSCSGLIFNRVLS